MLKILQITAVILFGVLLIELTLWVVWQQSHGPLSIVLSVIVVYASLLSAVHLRDKTALSRIVVNWLWKTLCSSLSRVSIFLLVTSTSIIIMGCVLYDFLQKTKYNVVIHLEGEKVESGLDGYTAKIQVSHQNISTTALLEADGRIRTSGKKGESIRLTLVSDSEIITFQPFRIEHTTFSVTLNMANGDSKPIRDNETKEIVEKAPASFDFVRFSLNYLHAIQRLGSTASLRKADIEKHVKFGLPGIAGLHLRKGYLLSYNSVLNIPNWTAYWLQGQQQEIYRPVFRLDPNVTENLQASFRSYRGSGFDRGNLVSGADMRLKGPEEVNEAYFMTAVAPQTPTLNRGVWREIERLGRRYAKEGIGIIAGPAFIPDPDKTWVEFFTIGEDEVAVPTHYFRILYRNTEESIHVLPFLVPNSSNLDDDLNTYLVSIDRIEALTGLNFFADLPDELENEIEEKAPTKVWVR